MNMRIVRSIGMTIVIICIAAAVALPRRFAEDGWAGPAERVQTSSKQNRLIIARGLLEEVLRAHRRAGAEPEADEKAWIEKEKKTWGSCSSPARQADAYAKKQAALMATPGIPHPYAEGSAKATSRKPLPAS